MDKVIVLTTIGKFAHPLWSESIFNLDYTPLDYMINRTGVITGSSDVTDKVNYQKRNIAVTDARNDLLKKALRLDWDYALWVDSDIEIPRDTVQRMLKYMDNGEKFVTAVGKYRQGHTVLSMQTYFPYNQKIKYCRWTGWLCNMLAREVHLNVGEFHANPRGEDVDYSQRALRMGYRIAIAEDVKINHYHDGCSKEALKC